MLPRLEFCLEKRAGVGSMIVIFEKALSSEVGPLQALRRGHLRAAHMVRAAYADNGLCLHHPFKSTAMSAV